MREIIIKDPIFFSQTYVVIGNDKELKEYTSNNFKNNNIALKTPYEASNDAHTYRLENKGCLVSLILIDTECQHSLLSILVHELYHAVRHVMRDIGVKADDSTEEVFAYFLSYLTDESIKELNKIIEKKYA